ncbi:MAG: HD-GYP domain-containing protein [Moorellales bacterium]
MRRLPISYLRPGMRVARAVFSSTGQLLINRGVILSDGIIRRLGLLGVPSLYVEDGPDLPVEDVISDETRQKAIQQVRELFVTAQEETRPLSRALVLAENLARTVGEIIEQLLGRPDVVVNLTDIRAWDDYTFGHSVNVCVLSLLTGVRLGLTRPQLTALGLGAILHDLGKVRVPLPVLQKPGSLTPEEFELVKQHAEWGYRMAKELTEAGPLAAIIPLQHHERYNGNGYPKGLKAGEIHAFAVICGLADVFDALTADRIYRPAFPVHEAYEYLAGSGNHLFDHRLLCAFLENLALYPTGTPVMLSTGEVAVVVKTTRGLPRTPLVRVVLDREGRPVPPYELDLAQFPDLVITRVLPPEEAARLPALSAAEAAG